MTRLTRKEINQKLQQIPFFFATESTSRSEDSIFIQDGVGKIFMEKKDADEYVKSLASSNNRLRVSTSTLDEVRGNPSFLPPILCGRNYSHCPIIELINNNNFKRKYFSFSVFMIIIS